MRARTVRSPGRTAKIQNRAQVRDQEKNTPEYKNCDICANDVFRDSWKETGVQQTAFTPPRYKTDAPAGSNGQAHGSANGSADQEALVQAITDRVLSALGAGK